MELRDEEKIIRSEIRENDGYQYRYELTVKNSKRFASFSLPLYSVSVKLSRDGEEISFSETNEIFADLGKATEFFELMQKHLVTPSELPYVLEDMISVGGE